MQERYLQYSLPFDLPLENNQASYLRVMIKTGQILASIAERQGYQVERIDLFRTGTRFATATQNELREEVVVLRWPGV